jgi:hypothetical protein
LPNTRGGKTVSVFAGAGTGGSFGGTFSVFDSTTVGHDLAVTPGDGTALVSLTHLVVQGRRTVRTGLDDTTVDVGDSTFLEPAM